MRAYRLEPASWSRGRKRIGQNDFAWLDYISDRAIPDSPPSIDQQKLQMVTEALDKVPHDLRELLLMRCNGLSWASIAELLDEPYEDTRERNKPSEQWVYRFDRAVTAVRRELRRAERERERAEAEAARKAEMDRRRPERQEATRIRENERKQRWRLERQQRLASDEHKRALLRREAARLHSDGHTKRDIAKKLSMSSEFVRVLLIEHAREERTAA
jgi:DNA-binding transcriptional MerR regulator